MEKKNFRYLPLRKDLELTRERMVYCAPGESIGLVRVFYKDKPGQTLFTTTPEKADRVVIEHNRKLST